MNIDNLIGQLTTDRDRLEEAIAALRGTRGGKSGRPTNGRRGPRSMSAATRKRMSIAQKKRWGARKKKS